jgi:hypothetical protein
LILTAITSFALCSRGQGTFQITFDEPPLQAPGTAYWVQKYFDSGMWFTPSGVVEPGSGFSHTRGGGQAAGLFPDNGTSYLGAPLGASLKFRVFNDLLFSVSSVDLAGYSSVYPDFSLQFVGYRPDGSTVTADFSGSGLDFQTFYFSPELSGLSRVEVPTISWSMDNLVVTIPEPSTGALAVVGAALFSFRLLRKKSRSS